MKYSDSYTHFKDNVDRDLTLASMQTFLARIKNIEKLSEARDLEANVIETLPIGIYIVFH